MWRSKIPWMTAALILGGCADPATVPDHSAAMSASAEHFWETNATVAWNETARRLVSRNSTGAIPAIRVYALVSVAQYNAVVTAEDDATRGLHPSVAAAVAGASAAVLTYLYPGEAAYLEGLVTAQEARPTWPGAEHQDFAAGETVGRAVAAAVIARAQTDRFFAPFTGTVPVCPGCWLPVPTPPAFATLGQAKTFFLTSGDQFRPAAPPTFGSAAFLAALAEVRQVSDTRTSAQDAIAKFWALPTGTVSPLGYWNQVASNLITQYHVTERKAAHALALMNMVAFDVIIASHEAKYTYWLIRPTQADPLITLAVGLPSFPSYPSNHAAVSASAATVLSTFFPAERAALEAQADEAAISRLFAGIHYRFDCDVGLVLGRTIAQYALDLDVVGHGPFVLR